MFGHPRRAILIAKSSIVYSEEGSTCPLHVDSFLHESTYESTWLAGSYDNGALNCIFIDFDVFIKLSWFPPLQCIQRMHLPLLDRKRDCKTHNCATTLDRVIIRFVLLFAFATQTEQQWKTLTSHKLRVFIVVSLKIRA